MLESIGSSGLATSNSLPLPEMNLVAPAVCTKTSAEALNSENGICSEPSPTIFIASRWITRVNFQHNQERIVCGLVEIDYTPKELQELVPAR